MYRNVFRRYFSTISNHIIKPYPSYVERQAELNINTSSGDEKIHIDREAKVQVSPPATYLRSTVNYVDTNPLGDKKQSIVLLVHGYPGNHQSTRNLIEEFQRRNFRCIAPDMPYCGQTKMPMFGSVIWSNSLFLRARFLGELLKHVMGTKLIPIHAVVGFHENAYTLMSLIDQYEYFRCQSLIMIDPAPRKLIRFLPLSKLAFDFGRLPLHWSVAKVILKLFGYNDLLAYSQKDIIGALRMWLTEETYQYDVHVHNLWLSRLRTMVILSQDDQYLDQKLLKTLIEDLAVVPFNKSKKANAVIRKYSCNHDELLSERISAVANDIETFLSTTPFSLNPSTIAQPVSSTTRRAKEMKKNVVDDDDAEEKTELDTTVYNRAKVNDFFYKAFGPSESELKKNEPHSFRSGLEHIAGGFIQKPPGGSPTENFAKIKEELRKKKIRLETKN